MNDLSNNDVYWWRPLDDAPLDTRGEILFAAYKEIHVNGFQSASLSNILARTGVTKGALYHHFRDKTELGYAVVDEVIARRIYLSFIAPLEEFDDPIEGFIRLIENAGQRFSMTDIELGCPLTVLAQEMAPIDEGFRRRLTAIYEQWHASIADVLAHPDHRPALMALGREAMAVAHAAGVRPEGFDGFDPAAFGPNAPEGAAAASLDDLVGFNRASAKSHSGVWRDLAVRKRKTEVDAQIDPIVRIGVEVGVACPTIERLVALIHDVEEGRRTQSWETLAALGTSPRVAGQPRGHRGGTGPVGRGHEVATRRATGPDPAGRPWVGLGARRRRPGSATPPDRLPRSSPSLDVRPGAVYSSP